MWCCKAEASLRCHHRRDLSHFVTVYGRVYSLTSAGRGGRQSAAKNHMLAATPTISFHFCLFNRSRFFFFRAYENLPGWHYIRLLFCLKMRPHRQKGLERCSWSRRGWAGWWCHSGTPPLDQLSGKSGDDRDVDKKNKINRDVDKNKDNRDSGRT